MKREFCRKWEIKKCFRKEKMLCNNERNCFDKSDENLYSRKFVKIFYLKKKIILTQFTKRL